MSTFLAVVGAAWLAPLSVLGWLVALVTWSAPRERRGTTVVCEAGRLARWFMTGPIGRVFVGGAGSIAAFTWGDVIIVRPEWLLDGHLLAHELEHVRQGHRWGPLFPLVYALAGIPPAVRARAWSAWYRANPFEVAARAAADEFTRSPRSTP